VPPEDGHEELELVAEARHAEAHAVLELLDVVRDHVAGLVLEAVVVFLVAAVVAHVPEQRLVSVEDAVAVFGQAAQDLQLGLQDALARAEMLDVHGADVRDDGDVGPRDRGEIGHLAEVVHAHLQHRDLGVARDGHDGHGQADVVVVVGQRLGDAEALLEHAGRHLLGRRLADAAGDADDPDAEQLAVARGDVAVGLHSVRHADAGHGVLGLLGHERRGRAALQRLAHEAVPVVLLSHDGDEEVARLDFARIRLDAVHEHVFKFRPHEAAAPGGDLFKRQFFQFPVSKYSATTSRSSRWCLTWLIS